MAACLTTLRTWLQYSHNKRLYTNDFLICFAIVLHVILSITVHFMVPVIYETFSGLRNNATVTSLPGAQFTKFLKYQFTVLYLIWTALWTVKLAMLSFFWRLFTSVQTNVRVFWWIMCGITIATWIVSLFLQAFACSPPSKSFNMGESSLLDLAQVVYLQKLVAFISPKSTAGWNRAFFFSSCIDIVTDFLSKNYPLPPQEQSMTLI